MEIPSSISRFFLKEHFRNYPVVTIPQFFTDTRGEIYNIADGELGDVAVIRSKANSVRANHIHSKDWHLSYLVEGEINYFWEENNSQNSVVIKPGQLFYTPPKVPHKMVFLTESLFIAVASMSRTQDNYEKDTARLDEHYFK
jgi:quercetin dioxygenase-like cupin family protein